MAIFEKTIRNQNFDTLLRKLEHACLLYTSPSPRD